MKEANEKTFEEIRKKGPESVNIESVQDEEAQHIELVLTLKQQFTLVCVLNSKTKELGSYWWGWKWRGTLKESGTKGR